MSRKIYSKIDFWNDSQIETLLEQLRAGVSLLSEYDLRGTGHLFQWNPNKSDEESQELVENNIKARQEIVMDIATALGVPFEYERKENE